MAMNLPNQHIFNFYNAIKLKIYREKEQCFLSHSKLKKMDPFLKKDHLPEKTITASFEFCPFKILAIWTNRYTLQHTS